MFLQARQHAAVLKSDAPLPILHHSPTHRLNPSSSILQSNGCTLIVQTNMPNLPLAYAWSPMYLIIILVVVILLFGGTKIPELMRGMGKGMGEFKKGLEEGKTPDESDDVAKRRKALEAKKRELEAEEEELKRLQ